MDSVFICECSANRERNPPITVAYSNLRQEMGQKSQSQAKTIIVENRNDRLDSFFVLYSMGMTHYKLLPNGQMISSEFYCQQVDRLKAAIEQKRPDRRGSMFHHGNARLRTSMMPEAPR